MEILVFDTHWWLSTIIFLTGLCSAISVRLLIFSEKNLWCRVLEANKKQVPPKSYSLKTRIDSVNQTLNNKEKVMYTGNTNILIRITNRKIPYVYTCAYHIIKNWGPVQYNSLCHANNRKFFLGLSLIEVKHTCFTWRGKWEKFGDVFADKKVTLSWLMNSNKVKP